MVSLSLTNERWNFFFEYQNILFGTQWDRNFKVWTFSEIPGVTFLGFIFEHGWKLSSKIEEFSSHNCNFEIGLTKYDAIFLEKAKKFPNLNSNMFCIIC